MTMVRCVRAHVCVVCGCLRSSFVRHQVAITVAPWDRNLSTFGVSFSVDGATWLPESGPITRLCRASAIRQNVALTAELDANAGGLVSLGHVSAMESRSAAATSFWESRIRGAPFKYVRVHGMGQARVLACWVLADVWYAPCIWPRGTPRPDELRGLVLRLLFLLRYTRFGAGAPGSAQRVLGYVPADWLRAAAAADAAAVAD